MIDRFQSSLLGLLNSVFFISVCAIGAVLLIVLFERTILSKWGTLIIKSPQSKV